VRIVTTLNADGTELRASSPEQFGQFIARETAKFNELARGMGGFKDRLIPTCGPAPKVSAATVVMTAGYAELCAAAVAGECFAAALQSIPLLRGATMIKLDINKLDESELKRIVAARCAEHGEVSDVMICDPTPVVDYKLAFVHTADPKCLARLVKAFEGIKLQGTAVIRLDPLRWMLGRDGVFARR